MNIEMIGEVVRRTGMNVTRAGPSGLKSFVDDDHPPTLWSGLFHDGPSGFWR